METVDVSVHYKTKNDIVYNSIKKMIVSGELFAGERLPVNRFTEMFGVSPMPIREALQRLQQEGLVTILPHSGAKVVKFDRKDFWDVALVRAELESMATRLSTELMVKANLNKLELQLNKMEQYQASNNLKEYIKCDNVFHRFIYKHCGNEVLQKLIDELWDQSSVSQTVFVYQNNQMEISQHDHRELFSAIQSRNAEEAERLMYEHKMKSFKRVADAFKK